jgi:hypothetical protein
LSLPDDGQVVAFRHSDSLKLSEAFEVLHEHGFGKSEPEKVFILLAGIKSNNQIITAATTAVRMNPEQSNDFRKASEALSELIGSLCVMSPTAGRLLAAQISSSTTEQGNNNGHDNPDNSGGRGGRGHGRGGGRGGGRGYNRSQWPRSSDNNETYERDGHRYHNGIDITDPLRHYSTKEWCSLHKTMQNELKTARHAPHDHSDSKRKVAEASRQENRDSDDSDANGPELNLEWKDMSD